MILGPLLNAWLAATYQARVAVEVCVPCEFFFLDFGVPLNPKP